MKFSVSKHRERNCVMYCETENDADVFLSYLDKIGRRWADGTKYNVDNKRHVYPDTVYYFNKGTYGSLRSAERLGYNILYFSDFEWNKSGYKSEDMLTFEDLLAI